MGRGIFLSKHNKFPVLSACLAFVLMAVGWAGDKSSEYRLVPVYQDRALRGPTLLRSGIYWRPDSSHVAVEVIARQVSPRFRDLVIFDIKQRQITAQLPVDIEPRKNRRPDNSNEWGPVIVGLKWDGVDRLLYLNSAGELVRANLKTNSVTKVKQVFVKTKRTTIGPVHFSLKRPLLYYLTWEHDKDIVRLQALNYETNEEQTLWTNESSKIPYCSSNPFVESPGTLVESPDCSSVLFLLNASTDVDNAKHIFLILHIVPLEENPKSKAEYISTNLPKDFCLFAIQVDSTENCLWIWGREHIDLDDDMPDLQLWRIYRFDLKTHRLEKTSFEMDCDKAAVLWWQFLPKRGLHAMVLARVKQGDEVEWRLCLYDKACSKMIASVALPPDATPWFYEATFSPSEDYLALRNDVFGFDLYKLETVSRQPQQR